MGEAKRRKNLDPNYGKISKSKSHSYFIQGLKCEEKKEYEKAIYFYSEAIKCDPSNSEAYFGRGNVYDDLKMYENAIDDYNQHLRLNRNSFKGFNNRALVYAELEQDERATSDLEQAIKLDSSEPSPYQQLGILLWGQGKLKRSIELLIQAAELYQKDNDYEGYQSCQELIDESQANLGLVKMALNNPFVDEVDWAEFENPPDNQPTETDDFNLMSEEEEFGNDQDDYECFGERADYFKNRDFHLNKGGAFEEGLPRHHKYRSVKESNLFKFIQNAIDHEEETANYILSKATSISDLTDIQDELLVLVDKSVMSKRNGDLNQAFKYYDQVFSFNQTWFMLWYGLAKLLCLFREYRMAFACIKICTYLYPKMWNGKQYHSDHNLSYHYDQIHSLAIAGEENEPYLKTIGRPVNTFRLANPNGQVKTNSPVGKITISQSKLVGSAIKTQKEPEIYDLNFPITPRKAYELNQRLKIDGLGWFYKVFMTQSNILECKCYVTEARPDTLDTLPEKFSFNGKDFFIPVICFHPQSNIIKVLGLKEGEIVLASRFQYIEQTNQKVLKPQFFGYVKIVDNIPLHYGLVELLSWDYIDWSDDEENSLIVNILRNSDDILEAEVKTLIEREELGISVDRILIKVSVSYPNQKEEQKWQEVFVYLLDNLESYEDRVITLINKKLGDNWLTINWPES